MSKLLIVFAALILLIPVCAFGTSVCDTTPNNLVVNCGFETGNFNGWTQSGNTGFTLVTNDPTYVYSGNYGAALGPIGSDGFLAQTTLPTVAGTDYVLSFELRNVGGSPDDFTATWDGQTPVALSIVNERPTNWFQYSYDVTATSNSTVLQFAFREDPAYWGLDDVVVQGRSSVPDGGMTLMLLGGVLVGLETLRRKLRA